MSDETGSDAARVVDDLVRALPPFEPGSVRRRGRFNLTDLGFRFPPRSDEDDDDLEFDFDPWSGPTVAPPPPDPAPPADPPPGLLDPELNVVQFGFGDPFGDDPWVNPGPIDKSRRRYDPFAPPEDPFGVSFDPGWLRPLPKRPRKKTWAEERAEVLRGLIRKSTEFGDPGAWPGRVKLRPDPRRKRIGFSWEGPFGPGMFKVEGFYGGNDDWSGSVSLSFRF